MRITGSKEVIAEINHIDLTKLGVEDTPEMHEFISQLSESAINDTPLAKPYLQAGAIMIRDEWIVPGAIGISAVGFHATKFAEMLKTPCKHMN